MSKDVYDAFEKAINDGSNNPNSQFYSLVIDGIDEATARIVLYKASAKLPIKTKFIKRF